MPRAARLHFPRQPPMVATAGDESVESPAGICKSVASVLASKTHTLPEAPQDSDEFVAQPASRVPELLRPVRRGRLARGDAETDGTQAGDPATRRQECRAARGFGAGDASLGGTHDHTHYSAAGLPADRGGLRAPAQAAHPSRILQSHRHRRPRPRRSPGGRPTASALPGEPLGNVSYHVRQLEKAGLIELVATRQRRGARALLHARVIDER